MLSLLYYGVIIFIGGSGEGRRRREKERVILVSERTRFS